MKKYIPIVILLILIFSFGFIQTPGLTPPLQVDVVNNDDFTNNISYKTVVGNYVFSLNEDKKGYSIIDYQGSDCEIAIPSFVFDKPITKICANSFKNHTEIKKIVFPNLLSKIESYAFEGCSFEEIEFSNGNALTICDYAFSNCTSLKKVSFPSDLQELQSYAFWGCSNLNKISIGENSVNYRVDNNCLINNEENALILATNYSQISTGIEKICLNAFSFLKNLERVTIPSSIKVIEEGAFIGCTNLKSITNNSNYHAKIGNCLVDTTSATLILCVGNFDIPDFVDVIGSYALSSSNVKNLTIDSNVTQINDLAFADCYSLESLTLGSMVYILGKQLFSRSNNLSILKVDEDNSIFSSENNGIYCENKLVLGCKDTIKKSDCDSIGDYAFYNVNCLKGFDFTNVAYIGEYAFYGCDLIDLILGESNIVVESNAFSNNAELSTINFGNLQSITCDAFLNCNKLTSLSIMATNTKYEVISNCLVELENNKLVLGTSFSAIPSITEIVGENAFAGKSITSANLPDCIKVIEKNAFYNCKNLSSVTFGALLESIGEDSFYLCKSITSLQLKSYVKDIGQDAFTGCLGIKQVDISCKKITTKGLLEDLQNLESVNLLEGVTILPEESFNNCINLKNITLPRSLQEIGSNSFAYCSEIESIEVAENNKYFYSVYNSVISRTDNSLVLGCKNSIFPSDITKIADAFAGNKNLTLIKITQKIKEISSNAFENCTMLKEVYVLSETVANNSQTASSNGHLLEYADKVYVLSSIKNIGSYIQNNYSFSSQIEVNGVIYNLYTK